MAGGNHASYAVEGAERMMGVYEFRWAAHSAESTTVYPGRRSHRDPTADTAIGNIMREERRKRKNLPPDGQKREFGGHQRRETCMRESEVEKAFVDAIKEVGGEALKFTSQTMNGVPDRLVLLLGGRCAFVELKAPGKQMRPQQRKRREQLQELGFPVLCVDRLEQIQPVIAALQQWTPGEPVPTGVGAVIPELENITLPGKGGDAR